MVAVRLCMFIVATVIHLTSSQSTCDLDATEDGDGRCEDGDQALTQLTRVNTRLLDAVSKLEQENSQLLSANSLLRMYVSQLMTNVSTLHRDIDELKAINKQQYVKECPGDFIYNASVNGCYKVVDQNMEWSIAGLECRSLHKDAHLLVINNASEQAAVAQLLDSINETSLSGCNRDRWQGVYFWTAGQRIDPSRESPFVWRVTSTSPCGESAFKMTYTNWHSGQPDYYNKHEACVNLAGNHLHAWNDYPCHFGTCFICEIDM